MIWPKGKKAAFAIIDDTDDAVMPDIARVYDILINNGVKSTKTVWVYPVRDKHLFKGATLTSDAEYAMFVKNLVSLGFEIGLHNVGSGDFSREEILEGLEIFRNTLGFYPNIHVNHSYNKDNIYGGDKRFSFPLNLIVRYLFSGYTGFEGEIPSSKHFWGDAHKRLIKFSRSYEIDNFNLLGTCKFPYADSQYSDFCNQFYPTVFCPNQDMFVRKVTRQNVEKLISENGCSIVYTHLGYYAERGGVDQGFIDSINMLSEYKSDIWFATVGEILNHLERVQGVSAITYLQKLNLQLKTLKTRFKYRYVSKFDDYHYKKSIGAKHRKS